MKLDFSKCPRCGTGLDWSDPYNQHICSVPQQWAGLSGEVHRELTEKRVREIIREEIEAAFKRHSLSNNT